ncbi:MAG TPA: hypothetical protein VF222_12025 [Nitrososphaeraceae archaeon]
MTDWDNIIKSKKNVRTKDNISVGNVVANYDNYILVIDGVINKHTYKIPKSSIESYNGSEILLNINHQDLKTFSEDFHKTNHSNSIESMFMDILVKGLSFMSGTVKIAIQDNESLRIESSDKKIKLHIIDPSLFEIPIETIKDNKMKDFLKYIKEAKEFAHKLTENGLTLFILNKDENAITLGKDAHPSFSKLITRSDDIQIDSIRKSLKLATDIKDEDK